MQMLATTKILASRLYLHKILQCSTPRAVAISVVLLQVKLFSLNIFAIFETSFESHQKSAV